MQPRIRTDTLTGYADLARSSGLDPAALMSQVGLDIADLDVPGRWIPAGPAAWLLERSAERAHCPDFALRIAGLRRLGVLGPLSVVLRDEPDLRSAVELLIRYERAYNEALEMRLTEADGLARVEIWLDFGEPAPSDQALDLVMAALLGIIRALVGTEWEPLSASFARPPPADAGPWHRLFGPRVAFGRRFTGMVLRARDLDAPILTSDASLRPYTREFLRTIVAAPEPDGEPDGNPGAADVAEVVEFLLPLGRTSMEEVSRRLGLGPRGLQRYLADQGLTYSSVLHATRARLVERYLPNDRYSLTDVSQLLGFGAPSAFSRWFRQQFGTTPMEWRRTARAGSRTGPRGEARPGGTVREG